MTVDGAGATATVERMRVRWRGAGPQRRAALLDTLLTSALPDTLTALGVGQHAEVCLRRVDVPAVVVGAGEADDAVARRWAGRVATAIADAVRAGDAVVFRSPHHALGDMAVGVARGDLTRAWAWRAAGVWPEGIGGSVGEPATSPVVRAAASTVADRAAGVPRPGEDHVAPRRSTTPRPAASGPPRRAPAAPGDLPPDGAVTAKPRPGSQSPAEPPPLQLARALAVLPGPPTEATPEEAEEEAAADEAAVVVATGDPAVAGIPAPRFDAHDIRVEPAPWWSAPDLDAAAEALAAALLLHPEAVAGVLAHVTRLGLLPALDARLGPARLAALSLTGHRPAGAATPASRVDEVVGEAPTGWGGLLLLLQVVNELPAAGMHALGTALLTGLLLGDETLDCREPALLAFSGLAPDDDPPAADDVEEPDTRLVVDRLHTLGLELDHVCRRPAAIIADPGWIEVRFSLDDVDVDIRRAGLDLDPGWLPWLGVVVRFTYA